MDEPVTSKLTPPPKGSELLRENLFEENADEDEGELLKRREPTMLRKGRKLVAPSFDGSKKYTVVFDLDETVVYARDGPLYARAYLKDLFRSIKDDFEVIVWTAGERDYAKCILEEINEDHIIQHLVYRHKKWFNEEDYTKDLRQLGRDLNYTIMIENTPDCVRANPQNGIIVEDFEVLPETTDDDNSVPPSPVVSPPPQQAQWATTAPVGGHPAFADAKDKSDLTTRTVATVAAPTEATEAGKEESTSPSQARRRRTTDRTLFLLREVLLSLVKSGDTVPAFLASCELLSQQTVIGSDRNEISIYHLGTRRRRKDAGAPRKVVRVNRDKAAPSTAVVEEPPANTSAEALTASEDAPVNGSDNGSTSGGQLLLSGKKRQRRSETSLDETPLLPSHSADSFEGA
ncbi:hypothetical protein ABB37_00475 [Leptomonas pyrrhocoris]|uniref:Mitochondrial import inner membrane translocase subunit TIM50 n=1 Tax=Leptomonas pyrrhocoris TaxID=157538 RepID=A0A0N0E0B1_LEPPY|nr:hypothetical protein ABB37_00475 [Leptomonas pyrrhocoris]KPA86242.1 hypothetical protein ABB37_00475 [Leptomonas pyrrhocoris]|eukprot:XP_015664681.1 hypothetical protein ABB37_00475 [Leptomonas pyrrhocoris]